MPKKFLGFKRGACRRSALAAVLCFPLVSCTGPSGDTGAKQAAETSGDATGDSSYSAAVAAYDRADYTTAQAMFRALSGRGNANAASSLGIMAAKGEGGAPDPVEARKWYRIAADRGHPLAQFNLGYMYDTGQGGTADHREAAKWYEAAAAQGDARAQFNMALLYAAGRGVNKDEQQAILWLEKAARQGHPKAPGQLAALLARRAAASGKSQDMERFAEALVQAGPGSVPGLAPEAGDRDTLLFHESKIPKAVSITTRSFSIFERTWQIAWKAGPGPASEQHPYFRVKMVSDESPGGQEIIGEASRLEGGGSASDVVVLTQRREATYRLEIAANVPFQLAVRGDGKVQ